MKKQNIRFISSLLATSSTLGLVNSVSEEEIQEINKLLEYEKIDKVEYFEKSDPKTYGMKLKTKKRKK